MPIAHIRAYRLDSADPEGQQDHQESSHTGRVPTSAFAHVWYHRWWRCCCAPAPSSPGCAGCGRVRCLEKGLSMRYEDHVPSNSTGLSLTSTPPSDGIRLLLHQPPDSARLRQAAPKTVHTCCLCRANKEEDGSANFKAGGGAAQLTAARSRLFPPSGNTLGSGKLSDKEA